MVGAGSCLIALNSSVRSVCFFVQGRGERVPPLSGRHRVAANFKLVLPKDRFNQG